VSFLEDLYRERQELARVLSNPEYSGIREIVEELYPDRAHFIFELLQNAEDTGATAVSFNLRGESLSFEHNGREFTEGDVRGITNIGKGTKKDQEDQIGRFGVGFKAVFAYTETPHIWSPTFSFKICELVLPIPIETNSALGQKTKFEFPFNNPKKRAKAAYGEIEAGLNNLEYTALLFLKNIRSVQWHIAPRFVGNLRRIEHSRSHIEISKQVGSRTTSAHFLQFSNSVEGLERQQTSIAFEMDFVPNVAAFDVQSPLARQLKISPANPGRVAVFFPAEKETSGLRFHLHAPFVPELSRASIKETPANEPLFNQLATLAAAALHKIRDLNLLNVGLLSVLPNPQDSLPSRYQTIRKAIVDEMDNENLTPTHGKSHAPAKNLLQAKASLKELLSEEDLRFCINDNKTPRKWAIGATQRNSDADRFLTGLAISEWDVTEFIELLCEKLSDGRRFDATSGRWVEGPDGDFTKWLSRKSVEWHQQMYSLLRAELLSKPEYVRRKVFEKLRSLRIVRLSDRTYSLGCNCYFPSEDVRHDEILPRVAAGVYSSGKSKTQQAEARKLLEELGVVEVGEREQVQAILKQRYSYDAEVPDEKTYLSDLRRFVGLTETDTNIASLFADYYIFKRADEKWATPSQTYLDSPFVNTGLNAYYNALGENADRGVLHGSYENWKLPVKKFLKFLENVGIQMRLEIELVSCAENPAFSYLDAQAPGRWSSTGVNEDYTIKGLDQHLKAGNEALSRLVWKTACETKETDWLLAKYRNNQNYSLRDAPSQLAYLLRHTAWIPQSNRTFVRPSSASVQLLPDGFPFDPGYEWLKAIHFGENERLQSEEHRQQQSLAAKLGFADSETLERAKRFAAIPREDQERILADFLRAQQADLPQREPHDPKRRSELVAGQAKVAPGRMTEERLRSISVAMDEVKSKAGQYLRDQYTNATGEMICQVCKTALPFKLKDGTYYFEKVEFLEEVEKRHYQNYLALCPNHSAMFRFANDSRDSMKELFMVLETNELNVVLAQEDYTVYFTRTHIADLKTVIQADESQSTSAAVSFHNNRE
jgi:hypothetical protein